MLPNPKSFSDALGVLRDSKSGPGLRWIAAFFLAFACTFWLYGPAKSGDLPMSVWVAFVVLTGILCACMTLSGLMKLLRRAPEPAPPGPTPHASRPT